MRKRSIFVSLFAICLCLCFLLTSCGYGSVQGNNGSTQGETNTSIDSSVESESGSESSDGNVTVNSGEGAIPDPPSETEKWRGQTLNVLATPWQTEEASAPWAQAELTVGDASGYGQIINSAVLERAEEIKELYGVEINWINARDSMISNLLSESIASGGSNVKYHIAMPRVLEAQTIVSTNSIYNLADRQYINLDATYYSHASIEAYTVHNRTLFVGGDFSFLDESSAYVTYYNIAITEGMTSFPDVYGLVKNGEWTIDQMVNVAKLVYKNVGDPAWTDDDTYGFGTTILPQFYQYSGIQQVSTSYGQYAITLDDPNLNTLIDKILTIKGSDWARTEWTGAESAAVTAFTEGRLMFYSDTLQKLDLFVNQNENFKVGVLPNPKLNTSQGAYYTPCANYATVMCVPKATPDREMSDFFVEALSYTGQKYIMQAYKDNLITKLDPDTATKSMEMIEDYVFKGIIYDPGQLYGHDGLLNHVQEALYTYALSSYNRFDYAGEIEKAEQIISDWNNNWMSQTG